jgi:hypothetical protein
MTVHSTVPTHEHVQVGGNFARVFDHEDYLIMFNSEDETSVVLRAHLILEEFLNIWCSQTTNTSDLFAGSFVPFKTKLTVSRNLGLSEDFEDALDKFNKLRNRYSHQRKYSVELSSLDALRKKINALPSSPPLLPCEQYHIYAQGTDQLGQPWEVVHKWESADTKKRLLLVFVQLVIKLVQWMQREFGARGIHYDLIVGFPKSSGAGGAA